MIGQTISHYHILEKLGEGGMGVVYKARDTKLDRDVALKFLPAHLAASEQDKARFVQEAKAAAALNHPNVCSIIDIQEHEAPPGAGKQMFIVMEFVDGMTLRQKMESLSGGAQPYPVKQAIELGIQVADGLAAAHEKGIVHRDIKPENIMVRQGRHRADHGFRARETPGDGHADHQAGEHRRHRRLHVPRAGPGARRRPPVRHFLARRAAV